MKGGGQQRSPPELNSVHGQLHGNFLLREETVLRNQWQPVLSHTHMTAVANLTCKTGLIPSNGIRVKRLTVVLGGLGSKPFAPSTASGLVLFIGSKNRAYGDLKHQPIDEARLPNEATAALDKLERISTNVSFAAPYPLQAHESGVDWSFCESVSL